MNDMQDWDGNSLGGIKYVNRKQPLCLMPPYTVQTFSNQPPFLPLALHLAGVK